MPETTTQEAAQSLCALLIQYGNERGAREAEAIQRATQANSPILPERVQAAVINAAPNTSRMTDRERVQFQQAIMAICGERQKPGPDKQFPYRLELRYDDNTKQALAQITERTGEDASTTIRRLIRESVA